MKKDTPESRFEMLRQAIAIEEAEELETFRKLFSDHTDEEREQLGKALTGLRVSGKSFSPAQHLLLTLTRATGTPLPFITFDTGDPVTLSTAPDMTFRPVFATVFDREEASITVSVNDEVPDWVYERALILNASANRVTYKKMFSMLDELELCKHKKTRLFHFRALSFGERKPEFADPLETTYFDHGLNEPQRAAVQLALTAKDVALVHGPPGTGKTRVLIEIIRQVVKRSGSVLASAPSNVACDNLLERLFEARVPVLRLGHPARILHHLRDLTLDHQLALHPYARMVDEIEKEIETLYKKLHSERRKHRARGDEADMREEIQHLKHERKKLERQLFSQVVKSARVMVGTHVSALGEIMRERTFDWVVLDEASQALEPLSWMPISKGVRLVLAGDHWQLPPTVRSTKAEHMGLGKSLFERMEHTLPEEAKCLLSVQYRMHEHIMGFSSGQFYGGKLIADASVKTHTLTDLSGVKKNEETSGALVFIDTAGCGFEEMLEQASESRFNPEEARLALARLRGLLAAGLDPESIALISPYSAQVRFLENELRREPFYRRLEIGSVDGFQGREKEAVIVSLVRSNLKGELGFLVDRRRMNVALTRARRKLIVIGDSATLSSIPFYRTFFTYAENLGAHRSAWEYTS